MRVKLFDSLAYRVHRCARVLRVHWLALLEREGLDITPEQWFAMHRLDTEGEIAQIAMSEPVLSDRPNISRLVKALESKGYVSRRQDPEDGRVVLVRLTTKGQKVCQRMHKIAHQARKRLFADITPQAQKSALKALGTLEESLLADL